VLSSNGSSYRLKIFIYFEHNIYSYFIWLDLNNASISSMN
jgi:hypothetical protein